MTKLLLIVLIYLALTAFSMAQDSTFIFRAYPNLYIPEEDTAGIVDTLEMPINVDIIDLNTYIGINTYRWADLLTIDVISPWADTVRLVHRNHDRYYLNVWFDTQDIEDGPGELEDYIGHMSGGLWIIQAAQWTGHMNFLFESWGIEVITRPTSMAGGEGDKHTFGVLATYPNPANATVKFDFAIESPGFAALDIFNVLGQRVAVVCQGAYKEGRYSAIWDALGMASGPYYYVFSSGGRKSQGRVTLLK